MKHALEQEYLNYHYTDEDRHTLLQYKALIDAMGALFGETCRLSFTALKILMPR